MSIAGEPVYLLDVNVLIALFDPGHIHHDAAHEWFATLDGTGWATCPLTENGFVRILSNPSYAGRRTTVADAVDRLRQFAGAEDHVFWPDDTSILDAARVDPGELRGHREITDAYLLALAVTHSGTLATFDGGIRLAAVRGAEPRHLAVLSR